MLARLLLLFTVVPIIELALLIQVGRWIGLWPTLALVIVTGVVGAALTRSEGLRAWRAFQHEVWEGRLPGRAILDGLAIFVGGALLLTPGVMTDAIGFLLLFRPTRRRLQDRVLRRMQRQVVGPGAWTGFEFRVGGSRPRPRDRDEPRGRDIG